MATLLKPRLLTDKDAVPYIGFSQSFLRNKGQQTIQVQHVQVNDGGKAIVGNIKTGGVNG